MPRDRDRRRAVEGSSGLPAAYATTFTLSVSSAGIDRARPWIAASSSALRSLLPVSKTSRTGGGRGNKACAGAGTIAEAGGMAGRSVGSAGGATAGLDDAVLPRPDVPPADDADAVTGSFAPLF